MIWSKVVSRNGVSDWFWIDFADETTGFAEGFIVSCEERRNVMEESFEF